MGLDICVYEKAKLADPQPEGDAGWDDPNLVLAFVYDSFPRSLRGLEADKWYEVDGDIRSFRAGSYSGYGEFRDALCMAALGVPPQALWDDPAGYIERPFYELIHFADNEGTIGPEACADLARDFAEQREVVLPKWDPEDDIQAWFPEKYDIWQDAFELAADTGLVQFC